MGNQPGRDTPRFARGDVLGAMDLNKVVEGLIGRIVGAGPISVRSTGSGIVVGSRTIPQGRTLASGAVPATITGYNVTDITGPPALQGGTYQADFYGSGYENDPTRRDQNCFIVDAFYKNSSKQLAVGENVTVFQSGGKNYIITERSFRITHAKIISGNNPYSWQEWTNYPGGILDPTVHGPLEVDGGAWEINTNPGVGAGSNVLMVQICPDDATQLPDGSAIGAGRARYQFMGPVSSTFLVQIMSRLSGGDYTVRQVKRSDHSVVSGGYSGTATEDTRSLIIPTQNDDGKASFAPASFEGSTLFFWYPLAPCAAP